MKRRELRTTPGFQCHPSRVPNNHSLRKLPEADRDRQPTPISGLAAMLDNIPHIKATG